MTNTQWRCNYCDSFQMTTDQSADDRYVHLNIGKSADGLTGVAIDAKRCLNGDCDQVSLSVRYTKSAYQSLVSTFRPLGTIKSWGLLPDSSAKSWPSYIPAALIEDYQEACLIKHLSPKASATLARRCLQGMIRDFCGISKGTLFDEIKELKKRVDDGSGPKGVELETLEAIDAIRKIGNIGAHLEKDINIIVEVDQDEAQILIGLLEMLFKDWYVAKNDRQARLKKIMDIALAKEADKKSAPAVSVDNPQ
ncbi:DUF4145 domain-containing protein [Agrobacterium rosae]|uniref:DUF4145 domain-containing protein n=1 Tax=Agrobacterium rosae TaxID=1972867 RepID=UPI003A803A37